MSTMTKRLLSLVMVVFMVCALLPVQAFAAQTEDHVHTQEQAIEEVTVSEEYAQVQAMIDEMLAWYLGEASVAEAVAAMDVETLRMAQAEVYDLEQTMLDVLSEEECAAIVAENATACEFAQAVSDQYAASMKVRPSLRTSVSLLDGNVSVTDSANTLTNSNGTLTTTAKGGMLSKKTNTVSVYNNAATTMQLSFDYTASTYSSFTIAGASAAASGTYTATLNSGEGVTLVIVSNSGFSNLTCTLKLSNITLTEVAAASNVTVNFDSALGSVTVAGAAATAGNSYEMTMTEGAALVATAKSGATFLGWVDTANGQILSSTASFTLKPVADMSVKAVFVNASSAPHFYVGGTTQKSESVGLLGMSKLYYHVVNAGYLFDDLNAAAAAAAASGNAKVVVLANSGTLPAGTYTIPSGVTLLIPFDSANTLYTTQGQAVAAKDNYVKPTAYRTLTMAAGANLVINGSMSLSAKHCYAQGSQLNGGSPTGAVSFVSMASGSNITVNNGGALYAYGFVTGSGTVTAKSGATVYENFQFMDFRGGTQSTDDGMKSHGVFPMSQYYVQNIEVPMTIESGATEYSYTTIYMSSAQFGSAVAFFGTSGAMFNLTSGSVVKRYDGATDRLVVESDGDLTVAGISMSVGTSDLNSSDYVLPINGNITVQVNSGTINLQQDIALLPGAEIIVGENAVCNLGENNKMIVYDLDQWGNYCAPGNKVVIPVTYAPGRTYTRTASDLKDAKVLVKGTVNASAGFAYTTNGNADICGVEGAKVTLTRGTETITYQLTQASDVANSVYNEIAIAPAKLKNADGTYVNPCNTTYTYTSGVWTPAVDHNIVADGYQAPTCDAVGNTGNQTCSTCGLAIASGEEIPALGHNLVTDAAIAPDCTNTGLTEGSHCDRCGHVEVAQEEVPALNHDVVVDAAVAPDCTNTGLTEGGHCGRCGEVLTAQEVVAALGHTEQTVPGTAPTCTATGLTDGVICSACGKVLVEQTEIAATGHSWGDWTETQVPTCNDAGVKSRTCGTCGAVETEPVEALGHSYVETVVAPTCTEQGYTLHACSACSVSYQDTFTEPTGHNWGGWVEVTAPTCEAAGEDSRSCGVCGETEKRTVDALGHNTVVDAAVAPDCTNTGLTEGSHCDRCGKVLVAQEVVEALGHTEQTITGKAPTCTESGLTDGVICSACGAILEAQTKIAAAGHSWGDWTETQAPTCENAGVKSRTCGACDAAETETVAALGHNYVETVVAPTCTEQGYTLHDCSACDASYQDTFVEATGHSWGEWADTQAPTCEDTGVKSRSCGACGATETETIAALGHNYVETVVAPTCTEQGYTLHDCSACDASYQDTFVEATGHSNAYVNNGDGTHDYTCSVCGTVEIDNETHTYTDGSCACGEAEPDNEPPFKGFKTTASIGLEEVIYIRATVAFTNPEGTANTDYVTKDQILANGRVLFWHGNNMPANWDEAVVGTETMNSGLTDAGEWGGLNEYWGISHGIEAKQYTDKVYFRTYIVVDGEEYYGEVSEYSVQTYAENQLGKAATTAKAKKLHTLLVAMLNYGTSAQAQFKYSQNNLANANIQKFIDGGTLKEANLPGAWNESMMNIRDAVPAEMAGEFTGNGLSRTNRTLNLAGAIFARMVFGLNVTNDYAAKPADGTTVTFYFWSEKDYDKLSAAGTALSKDNATYTKEGVLDYSAKYGYEYLGDTDGIAAKQMRDTIYVACVFAQPDGTEYTSGVEIYNAHVYAASKLAQSQTNTLGLLLQDMVVYGEAAKAYFG